MSLYLSRIKIMRKISVFFSLKPVDVHLKASCEEKMVWEWNC